MKIVIKVIVALASFVIVGLIGYEVGKSQSNKTTNSASKEVILPSCDSGRCPIFVSADVDGDNLSESVVYQPIGMTKGAAVILIIKDNKIVFSKGGAQFSYKINNETIENDTGVTTTVVDEWDESGLKPKTWLVEKWKYKNNDYVLDSQEIVPFKTE